jgi:transposase
MKHYAGMDVSLDDVSVCVVDEAGKILLEAKVASEPAALVNWFRRLDFTLERIGMEAGPLSQWLHAGMREEGLPVELLETRHVRTAFKTMPVKTDRKDARGIAQLMRMGWFRPVHCKSMPAQEMRALLTTRKLVLNKRIDVEIAVSDALLAARTALTEQLKGLETRLVRLARAETRVRLLMSVPGVGVIVALTYVSAIDDPGRFKSSKAVGPHFGLTPRRYQSGETDIAGGISKTGDAGVRAALYEAAHVILTRPVKGSTLKSWAARVAARAGLRKATVALARKLAVILHRMLADGTTFVADKAAARAAA